MHAPTDFFPAAREIVAGQIAARSASSIGVHFSAMAPEAPKVETVEAVAAKLERRANDRAEFEVSPRGRFYLCISEIEALGYYAEAAKLRAIYGQSLSDDAQPLNVSAVGAALAVLNSVPGKDARSGIDALSEMLLAARPADLLWAAE